LSRQCGCRELLSVVEARTRQAKDIYLAAFNHAWEEYKNPEDRRGDESREEVAHKVAWAAVKQKYQKSGDDWVEK